MWKQKIHGLKARQSYAGFITSKERSIRTVTNAIEGLVGLFEKGVIDPTNEVVAGVVDVSVRQWQKVKKVVNSGDVFVAWVQGLHRGEIVIRAYVTPLFNRVWKMSKQAQIVCDRIVTAMEKSEEEQYQPPNGAKLVNQRGYLG